MELLWSLPSSAGSSPATTLGSTLCAHSGDSETYGGVSRYPAGFSCTRSATSRSHTPRFSVEERSASLASSSQHCVSAIATLRLGARWGSRCIEVDAGAALRDTVRRSQGARAGSAAAAQRCGTLRPCWDLARREPAVFSVTSETDLSSRNRYGVDISAFTEDSRSRAVAWGRGRGEDAGALRRGRL